jgi:hydrogenase maturation protease
LTVDDASFAEERKCSAGYGEVQRRVLVLGYGNPGRQDDGLGPAVAAAIEQLGLPGVVTYDNYQLVVEDVLEIAAADIVWFVDASLYGAPPFEIRLVTPASAVELSSHSVRPEVLLALAKTHYGRVPEAWLMGVRGYRFEFAEGLSCGARDNLRDAVVRLTQEIRSMVTSAAVQLEEGI